MVSKNDLAVGILVLIAGIVIYGAAPSAAGGGGFFYQPAHPPDFSAHNMTHYVGGGLAIVFGIIGLALYKKVSMVTVGVSVLSIIIGLIFVLFAAGNPLFPVMMPHGLAMASVGGLTLLIGIIGIAGSAAVKKK